MPIKKKIRGVGIFISIHTKIFCRMTQEGLQLIISHEGFRSAAYWDRHGKKWTIGYGTTVYPNGRPVRRGETITREKAAAVLRDTVEKTIVPRINSMVTARLNQWQLDALTSFAYNCGTGNLGKSTLLQKVNANPNDTSIWYEFLKWNKAGGEVLKGLTERRANEARLYFKGTRPDPNSPSMRHLSQDFRQNYADNQGVFADYAANMRREKAVRGDLSRQFRERYSNSPEMARWAETQRAVRDMKPNLSQDFRQNYGSSQGLLRNAKANGGAVDESLVRKAVAEVVSERLRGILG